MLNSARKMFASLFGNQAVAGTTLHPSQTCPECGSKMSRPVRRDELGKSPISEKEDGDSCNPSFRDEDAGWRCPNPDCPAQIRAGIAHWCSPAAMDIAGGNAALVAKLVAGGLARDVAELYRLKAGEIAAIEGMDKDAAKSFFEAITASRKREAWRLLFGLGIVGVGAAEARSLCRHFASVDNVFAASAERLMQAEGIGAETARGIIQWHGDSVNRRLVKRLFKAGLNFACAS